MINCLERSSGKKIAESICDEAFLIGVQVYLNFNLKVSFSVSPKNFQQFLPQGIHFDFIATKNSTGCRGDVGEVNSQRKLRLQN